MNKYNSESIKSFFKKSLNTYSTTSQRVFDGLLFRVSITFLENNSNTPQAWDSWYISSMCSSFDI